METSPLAMGRARYRLHPSPPGRGPGRGDRTSPRQPFKNLPLPLKEAEEAINDSNPVDSNRKIENELLNRKSISQMISYLKEQIESLPGQIKRIKNRLSDLDGIKLSNKPLLRSFVHSGETSLLYENR